MVQLKLSAFSGFWVPLSWIPSPQCPEAGKEFRYLPVSPPLCALEPPATWPAHRRLAGCLPPSPSAGQVPLTRPPAQKEPACPATAARLVPRQQTSSGPRSALAGCAAPPPFSRPRRRRRRRAEGGGGWISRPRRRRRGAAFSTRRSGTFPRRPRRRRRLQGRRERRRRSVGPRCACCRVVKEQRRTPRPRRGLGETQAPGSPPAQSCEAALGRNTRRSA